MLLVKPSASRPPGAAPSSWLRSNSRLRRGAALDPAAGPRCWCCMPQPRPPPRWCCCCWGRKLCDDMCANRSWPVCSWQSSPRPSGDTPQWLRSSSGHGRLGPSMLRAMGPRAVAEAMGEVALVFALVFSAADREGGSVGRARNDTVLMSLASASCKCRSSPTSRRTFGHPCIAHSATPRKCRRQRVVRGVANAGAGEQVQMSCVP